ncbi:MAG: glycosyl hydrolase family 28-related protein [Terrimicrobiaceae bacterium]|nr:glycosyl hydrolase family 28-related protein [Terrimicrobiaceae bacterium]
MKKLPLGIRNLILSAAVIFTMAESVQAIDIPVLTWTPRSDWIDVTSSPYLADKTGATDSTTAINNALRDAAASPDTGTTAKKTVYFPAGTYKISSTLTWNTTGGVDTPSARAGLAIIGCGKSTIIKWYGLSGQTMFSSNSASRSRYIGITWDGRNIAGTGFYHNSTENFETRIWHTNEAFKNFTGYGLRSRGQDVAPTQAAAHVFVRNCYFSNISGKGLTLGELGFNDYNWIIDGCQFEDCNTGIFTKNGKASVMNNHFENSTVSDIDLTAGGGCLKVRHNTSHGSRKFFQSAKSGSLQSQVIQDCLIDSWTNTDGSGAITFGARGSHLITDCVFTHAPAASPPVVLDHQNGPDNATKLLYSNNYCSTISLANLYQKDDPADVLQYIPSGAIGSQLTSASTTFLSGNWPADAINIIDVTKAPYLADNTGGTDVTDKIQQAITYAMNLNNGSIVYLPVGRYKILTTLAVTGGNYSIQGSGLLSKLLWYGPEGGTMMTVATPQNITLTQFTFGIPDAPPGQASTTTSALVTSTGACKLVIDGVYTLHHSTGNPGNHTVCYEAPGTVLKDLPAGANVLIRETIGPLTVDDCGRANIFQTFRIDGRTIVKGSDYAKTGYFYALMDNSSGVGMLVNGYRCPWAIDVMDNQSLTLVNHYGEAEVGDVHLSRGAGTTAGVVAIGGFKAGTQPISENDPTPVSLNMVNIENYQGAFLYADNWFNSGGAAYSLTFTHTGTNAVDLIYLGNNFGDTPGPTFTNGTGATFIRLANTKTGTGTAAFLGDNTPAGSSIKIAASLDEFRKVAAVYLRDTYRIFNPVLNTSAELDAKNDNPTTVLGFMPASWTITGDQTGAGSTVRQVTTVAGASPFGPGSQSMRFIDNTPSTSGGVRLQCAQSFAAALGNDQGAAFWFDFCLNSGGTANNFWIRAFAKDPSGVDITGCYLRLQGAGGTVLYDAKKSLNIGSPLAVGTWYRARVVMPAPGSAGTADATLYLTPWAGSGPGATTSYQIGSFGSSTPTGTGFYRVGINTSTFGQPNDVTFDNIMLQTGEN